MLDYNEGMTNATTPSNPSGRPSLLRRAGRALFTTWSGRISVLLVLALFGGGTYWYHEHHAITWHELFSPSYWIRRWRGDDLYDPGTALLMHGNRGLREVALTFDDGPHRQSCGLILDTLKRYGVHATFFDVGMRMAQNPDLLLRTLADGNEVGNHTYDHPRLIKIDSRKAHREINDTDITFYRITGRHLYLLRPPGMDLNSKVLNITRRMGYLVVGENTASHDFAQDVSVDFIVNRTLSRVENGSIILLHDYPKPAAALPRIIEGLQAQGYRIVTVSEMISHLPDRQRIAAEEFLQSHIEADRLARQNAFRTAKYIKP